MSTLNEIYENTFDGRIELDEDEIFHEIVTELNNTEVNYELKTVDFGGLGKWRKFKQFMRTIWDLYCVIYKNKRVNIEVYK